MSALCTFISRHAVPHRRDEGEELALGRILRRPGNVRPSLAPGGPEALVPPAESMKVVGPTRRVREQREPHGRGSERSQWRKRTRSHGSTAAAAVDGTGLTGPPGGWGRSTRRTASCVTTGPCNAKSPDLTAGATLQTVCRGWPHLDCFGRRRVGSSLFPFAVPPRSRTSPRVT